MHLVLNHDFILPLAVQGEEVSFIDLFPNASQIMPCLVTNGYVEFGCPLQNAYTAFLDYNSQV